MKYKEIEVKHRADKIKLTDFILFCQGRNPNGYKEASGWDRFFNKEGDDTSFYRHRVGPDKNELTFKRKLNKNDSRIRTEINTELDKNTSIENIKEQCCVAGYEYEGSLFKNCFIFDFDNHIIVYYICYDKEMKELGRYLEIEAKEDYSWRTQEEAWGAVVVIERICKPLGITSNTRVDLSLYELFIKGNKK